ncbi:MULTISPECIES: glycosyltransferase family 2 protein [Alteromonas]|jgi:hypothetical protein|uniref:glycosyltransferase family 2 protein n=1 Tax=Alteromonas TaxID=226 RepID=UPI001B3A5FA1|nr:MULTISPECIES: glycosyltransferase family 2 protein [Alteromonas]MBQ4831277.1 glycosyltransferase family 2 protein [Alteromonas sp. MMG017]MDO6536045.1 glycosyltransferase family 2 protein [Alteromonas stellipolaris]MDO6627953.1 glycosyltransferase family 2 protein [Alteromonas stellipolaris]
MSKIKLVAIAKDEAAYLPEWIFHHLHFGFHEIEILINRTSDNTEAVLCKIVHEFPQVSFRRVDWIDTTPPNQFIQYIAYAESYNRASNNATLSHICFLDIDEFWVPEDFKSSISDIIEQVSSFETLSFHWLNILNEKEFSHITRQLHVQPAPTVKSVINLSSKIKKIQLHLPLLENGSRGHMLSNHKPFLHSPKERQRLQDKALEEHYPAYILHRMYRSELEYISLLQRGRPSDSFPFKRNRPGYIKKCKNERFIEFNELAYNNYRAQFDAFLLSIRIGHLLDAAKRNIERRALNTVDLLNSQSDNLNPTDEKDLVRIFSGLQETSIRESIEKIKLSSAKRGGAVKGNVASNADEHTFQYGLLNKFGRKLRRLAKLPLIRK